MKRTIVGIVAATALVLAAAVAASSFIDVGKDNNEALKNRANQLFGDIGQPLEVTAVQGTTAGAGSVELASKLKVTAVLRGDVASAAVEDQLYQNADMIALWPTDEDPEWGFACIENGEGVPGVQRIKLRNPNRGKVETLLKGTRSCDGIRRTPWKTIVATEERPDGWALEIYNPTMTAGVTFNRVTGAVSGGDAANVVPRPALGRFAWEGLEVLPDGTVYAGDELSPSNDADGGAIFKFTSSKKPSLPLSPETVAFLSNPANAAQSPLAAGTLAALRVGGPTSNFGQANQRGLGSWIAPINPAQARSSAADNKATGFYRPEDLQLDPIAWEKGHVRFCWTNTGVSTLRNWGEVLCATDGASGPEVHTFLEGNPLMNQPDNLAFQPGTGIVYIIEDSPNLNGTTEVAGDIWACLPDGADDDLQTDGCVRVVSVTTAGAEPTGFLFDASGRTAYLHVQHSPNDPATPVNEDLYDELLVIEGFNPDKAKAAR